jgi:DNA-binding transcriptional LysR family regulator
MFEWGDIRVFLSLARHGTTGRAAKDLGCSQPTVVRRIAALEESLGFPLFTRGPTGFDLTESGSRLLPAAERAASAMQGVTDALTSLRQVEREKIRVTLLDQWEGLMVPVIQQHRIRWPGVEVQMLTSYRRFDLGAGEADIALRAGASFDEEDVLTRRMPDVGWGIYVSRTLAEDRRPRSLEEVSRLPMAGGDGNLALLPAMQWFEGLAGPSGIAVRCNGFAAVRAAIIEGAVGLLPCVAGGADAMLYPCFSPIDHLMVPTFLGARRNALQRPAVRDLFEALSHHIQGKAALMGGTGGTVVGCC